MVVVYADKGLEVRIAVCWWGSGVRGEDDCAGVDQGSEVRTATLERARSQRQKWLCWRGPKVRGEDGLLEKVRGQR